MENETTGTAHKAEQHKGKKSYAFFTLIICIGLCAGLVLKLFVVEILTVSGTSMVPTLKDGDKIVVNKLAYGIVKPYGEKLLVQWKEPERGDIVIYLYDNKIVVKRCIAAAGDSLEYSADNDYNYVLRVGNTEIALTESHYLNLRNSKTVPDGYILAVGDNYEQSVDSRTYGFVSTYNILGKVLCR